MSRRLKACLMLLVLGLLLPVAGAPLRYCLCVNAIVQPGSECCDCEEEQSCDCHGKCPHAPSPPSCSVAFKLVPDSVPFAGFATPIPVAVDLPPATFLAPVPIPTEVPDLNRPRERGPPSEFPLYLRNLSMLL
jgi:hypothetical protein